MDAVLVIGKAGLWVWTDLASDDGTCLTSGSEMELKLNWKYVNSSRSLLSEEMCPSQTRRDGPSLVYLLADLAPAIVQLHIQPCASSPPSPRANGHEHALSVDHDPSSREDKTIPLKGKKRPLSNSFL